MVQVQQFETCAKYGLKNLHEKLVGLQNECVDEKDYLLAIDVWIMFKMKTMTDYHDFCLKTNISLLADVFERFIDMCLEHYGLYLSHYFSSPLLNCDAMLEMTKIELELISDTDM